MDYLTQNVFLAQVHHKVPKEPHKRSSTSLSVFQQNAEDEVSVAGDSAPDRLLLGFPFHS